MDRRIGLNQTNPVVGIVPAVVFSLRVPTQVIGHNTYGKGHRTYRTFFETSPRRLTEGGHHLNTESIVVTRAHRVVVRGCRNEAERIISVLVVPYIFCFLVPFSIRHQRDGVYTFTIIGVVGR